MFLIFVARRSFLTSDECCCDLQENRVVHRQQLEGWQQWHKFIEIMEAEDVSEAPPGIPREVAEENP